MERIGLEPGTEIGGYRILSPLGSGAMGIVYKAVDGGGTRVALKLLHPNFAPDAEMRRRLGREVAALQKVRHPSVAQVLDAEADSAEMFIVTELVDGPDLEAEIAAGGPLDPIDLHELADQLHGALTAVHAAGVIHRDLKPSNVLISDEGPVLIDFGIAHGMEDARVTSAGFVMGTPGYLAPELLDRMDPSPQTDWWGWAALLVYAATGRAPFGVRPLEAVIARARSGEPDLAGLGPVTSAALGGALAADPAERWAPHDVVASLRTAAEEGDEPADEPAVEEAEHPGGGAYGGAGATEALTAIVAAGAVPAAAAGAPASNDGHTALLGAVPSEPAYGAAAEGGTVVIPVGHPSPSDHVASAPPFIPVQQVPDQYALEEYARGPADLTYPAPAGPDDGYGRETYVRPVVRRRTGSVLALGATVVAAGATYPGRALVALVLVVVCVRLVGTMHSSFYARRERRGARTGDVARAAVRAPWHLVRALAGTIPSLLVAASTVVVVCGVLWWLLGTGRLGTSADPGAGRPGGEAVVVGLAMVIAALLLWFGPGTSLVRQGGRVVLGRVAPGWIGATVLVLLALVATGFFVDALLAGHPIVWSPLQEPPSFEP